MPTARRFGTSPFRCDLRVRRAPSCRFMPYCGNLPMAGPPPEEQPMRRLSVVLTAVVFVVAVAGCSSSKADNKADNKAEPRDSTARTLDTRLTQRQQDERDITALLKNWHRDFEAAKESPAESHPELAKWATPTVVAQANNRLHALAAKDQHSEQPAKSRAAVKVVALRMIGDHYAVTTCELNDYQLIDSTSGRILDATTAIYRTKWEAAKQSDGAWRLTRSLPAEKVGKAAGQDWERQCAS